MPVAPQVILIGTGETVGLARRQLALLPDAPVPIGCVLLQDHAERSEIGLEVLGTVDDLPALHARLRLSLAVVSLPGAMSDAIVRVRAVLRELGIAERALSPLSDLLIEPAGGARGGAGDFWTAPKLDIAELIGRSAHGLDRASVARILTGKRVVITGAGGSIGSELARIVAGFAPEQIVLMERAENALFEIDRRIGRRFPGVARRALMHDVVDAEATFRHLVELRPHVVFHAAAHKHVPLMEDHPAHAVANNVFGTKSIADASRAAGVERFVMISSDKAVNPSSVMGATKRLAELYVQSLNERADHAPRRRRGADAPTRFSMVRFGNVLGSACSVLPIWAGQLSEGGPITVTDSRMTRYFMTIPEAATLVIQAAAIDPADHHVVDGPHDEPASVSDVYVLDMGEPVRILDLAERFVRAHGFEPRVRTLDEAGIAPHSSGRPTIDIVLIGARPGEKLHEELSYAAEQLRPTPYAGINAWAGRGSTEFNTAAMVADLSGVRGSRDRAGVLAAIRRHLPEMTGGVE